MTELEEYNMVKRQISSTTDTLNPVGEVTGINQLYRMGITYKVPLFEGTWMGQRVHWFITNGRAKFYVIHAD